MTSRAFICTRKVLVPLYWGIFLYFTTLAATTTTTTTQQQQQQPLHSVYFYSPSGGAWELHKGRSSGGANCIDKKTSRSWPCICCQRRRRRRPPRSHHLLADFRQQADRKCCAFLRGYSSVSYGMVVGVSWSRSCGIYRVWVKLMR